MSNRPLAIRCVDCPTIVEVKPKGRKPLRCKPCGHAAIAETSRKQYAAKREARNADKS